MRKPYQSFIAALLVVLAVLTHATSTIRAQGMPPTLVAVDQVSRLDFHNQVTLVGRTEARVHSKIISEVSGRVIRIDAPEGNEIQKGKPLVSIDSEKIALDLAAKDAELKQAETQAGLAASNLKRSEELFKQSLIRQITLDSAQAWAQIADARYRELKAQRDRLALDVQNCTVRAPYSGYTLRRLVDVGEWVTEGTPVYDMVDLSEVTVTVDLPERYYGRLAIGSEAVVNFSGDLLNQFTGKVTGIARQAIQETHTFPVLVTIREANGRIGAGKLVRATLSLDDMFSSLAVSKDAIVRQGLQTSVYTIVDGKATPIPVETSSPSGKMIAVQGEGLQEGMPVVVRGNERIFPGSPVRVEGDTASGPMSSAEPGENAND